MSQCEPESKWSHYYDAVGKWPPRDTLLKALALFDGGPDQQRFAIDLGCGSGIDTRELLRRGWEVLAIDREPEAIRRVLASVPDVHRPRLKARVAGFEELSELVQCDLVNASRSLPFCSPAHFGTLWRTIASCLRPRGRFAGTLFGDRDGWANDETMTFHTHAGIDALLQPFKVEMLIEEERDGQTALGKPKHWHTFQIVAFKR